MIAGIWDFLVRMLPGILAAGAAYALLLPLRRRRLARAGLVSPPLREWVLLLFVLFCGGLALLTLTPRWFHWLDLLTGRQTGRLPFFQRGSANLIPFRTVSPDPWSLMILLGNVVMFLPIGFFPALLWEGASRRRILAAGLLSPLFIECWQLLIGRAFDVDDLLLNLLGVLAGWLSCRALGRLLPDPVRRFQVHRA